ncbi:hypothetical protein JZ751_025422 [Albula glossodonta]|uniref:Uncharacterized protein n=1 Tax=Albula glossodonta TaxID=121402 RepID=A0A8T2MT86_9TELE|nr:hypothetical protein JZ751_025422 [Albula glossodonta]
METLVESPLPPHLLFGHVPSGVVQSSPTQATTLHLEPPPVGLAEVCVSTQRCYLSLIRLPCTRDLRLTAPRTPGCSWDSAPHNSRLRWCPVSGVVLHLTCQALVSHSTCTGRGCGPEKLENTSSRFSKTMSSMQPDAPLRPC